MILITTLALAVTLQEPALPPDSTVRAFLLPRVASMPDTGKHGTGIVIGLLDAAGTRRIIAAGVDSAGVFEIGSITKVFTTSLLQDMVDRGEVRLGDAVSQYLPKTVKVPARNDREITLLDLATQSSGLPRLPSNLTPRDSANPYADYSVPQMYTFLSGYQLTRDPGAEYEYSNLGMGLLGHALSLKGRASYEELLRRRILTSLGLRETAITLTPAMRAKLQPGHNAEGRVVPNWDLPTLAGAGALRSTVSDMLTFVAANLDSAATPLSPTLRRTHAERHATNNPILKMGLGWHILARPVGNIVWHNGGTGGYRTFTGFDPVRRLGVVVLSNYDASVDDIGFHLLDETFPLRPIPRRRMEVAVDSSVLMRYVGEYELAPTFHVVVTREAARLFVQATGQPRFPVFAESDSTFFLRVVDAQITFSRDVMTLHQNGQSIPGRKIREN